MNQSDIKRAIQSEIDSQELIEALAVMGYIMADPPSKEILVKKYVAIITKHQAPVQPKDHVSLRDYEDSMRGDNCE